MCPRVKSRPPITAKSTSAKLWILLVGVNQYQDLDNLSSLEYSALDCQGLGEALKEATASFAAKEMIIHHDFVPQRPYIKEVQRSLLYILNSVNSEDTILFYFSGHGILDAKTQQVVLCLADTNVNQLFTTGLPLNNLLNQLGNCAASQQLVWLDACHSGGMTLRGTNKEYLPNASTQLVEVLRHQASESKGFYALLSCDQTQQSWEFPELGHGVFTYYLMRGLRGEAADSQGVIEADALYQYVYHQTLRYIDKTNQQIRLINQQKSSRGEARLQSEFPLQTPKRIVEGFGKLVLGKKSHCNLEINPRQGLVIDGGFKANRTTFALSQILQHGGQFNLRYFPQTNEPWSQVKGAIINCLNAKVESKSNIEVVTALIYLRGEIENTSTGESWLVLGDGVRLSRSWIRKVLKNSCATQHIIILDCPGENSLAEWVEDLQLEAERGQCIIAANAPLNNSGQFADAVLETLKNNDNQTELTVAAWITQLQISLAGTGILPQIWLSGSKGVIDILPAKNIAKEYQSVFDLGICPYMGLEAFREDNAEYFYGRSPLITKLFNQINHNSSIAVVGASGSGKSSVVQAGLVAQLRQGKQIPNSDRWWVGCFRPGDKPIQALAKVLTDSINPLSQAQEQLQIEGLLYQGVDGFVCWLRTRTEPMVLLIIDQFEELFTLAKEGERQEFLNLILGAIQYASDRFKFILTIRADFVAACLEIPALAQILQQSTVLVPPYLTEADYRSVIVQPAKQVGLKVESGLVELLLQDLDRSAGDLPLLQFTLQQLWQNRQDGQLTLNAYQKLGGVKGALERQAQAVYDSLDPQSQDCARWIFLNLTQLGEGTEDTRRRITKSDLIVAKYPEKLIDQTLQILTDAKLLVLNIDDGSKLGQSRSGDQAGEEDQLLLATMRQEATVEVVHEILIRHWSTLRWWLEENRTRLRSQRQIEQAALLWQQKDCNGDFLLRGIRLAEAEEIFIKYTDELSNTAKEFVAVCIDAKLTEEKETKQRLRKAQLSAIALGILGLAASSFAIISYRQKLITKLENIDSYNAVAEAQLLSNQQLESRATSVKAGENLQDINRLDQVLVGQHNWLDTKFKTAATLQQSIYGTQEMERWGSDGQQINRVSVSDDGLLIAGLSDDQNIKIWSNDGDLIKTLPSKEVRDKSIFIEYNNLNYQLPNPIAIAASKKYLISFINEKTVEIRNKDNNKIISSYSLPEIVTQANISPDGQIVATATVDGKIQLWGKDGILQQTLNGHSGEVLDLKFIPHETEGKERYQLLSTGVDKTIRIWQVYNRYLKQNESIYTVAVSPTEKNTFAAGDWNGKIKIWQNNPDGTQKLIRTIAGHNDSINQIKYSPDGKLIASVSWERNIKIWNAETGQLINTLRGNNEGINTIAFTPDGQTLVSGGEDRNIKIWNVATGQLINTLTGHTDSIKTVTISPDGKMIATAGYDKTIKIWSIAGELLQTINAHNLAINSLQFTPDSKILASASWDNTIKLWLIKNSGTNSELLHILTGHQDGVTTISFNSDGTVIATGSGDRTIKLWDTQTGSLIKNLRGHTSQINSLAFSIDDQYIISGEEQQGLFWWNLNLDSLLTQGLTM
ncbi:WD-40 repeat protein [Chondrocystis sp. NIES-4102]|nr:WD-40 repeat protein [Chondrocystis sp. NIES-4102]